MATIRAYTTIEQSRKLVKILPLESADMFHFIHEVDTVGFGYKKDAAEHYSKTEFEYLPCWSVAALLDVLPDELGDNHFLTLNKEDNEYCFCYEDVNGNSFRHTFADNPIDACVAMIEKLNELNLL